MCEHAAVCVDSKGVEKREQNLFLRACAQTVFEKTTGKLVILFACREGLGRPCVPLSSFLIWNPAIVLPTFFLNESNKNEANT